MLHLRYYKDVFNQAKKEVIQEELNYLINELQKDQKKLKILVSKIDQIKIKRNKTGKISKKDLDSIFRINESLKQLTMVGD